MDCEVAVLAKLRYVKKQGFFLNPMTCANTHQFTIFFPPCFMLFVTFFNLWLLKSECLASFKFSSLYNHCVK